MKEGERRKTRADKKRERDRNNRASMRGGALRGKVCVNSPGVDGQRISECRITDAKVQFEVLVFLLMFSTFL